MLKCRTVGKSETTEMAAQQHVLMIFTLCLVGDALCVVNTSSGHGTGKNGSENVAVNTSNVNYQKNVTFDYISSDDQHDVEYANGVNESVEEQSVYDYVDLGNQTLLENKTDTILTDEETRISEGEDLKNVEAMNSTLGDIIHGIPITSNVSSKPGQNMTGGSTDQEEYYDIENEEAYADNSTLSVAEDAEMELLNKTQLEGAVDISNKTNFNDNIVLDDSKADRIGGLLDYKENFTLPVQNLSLVSDPSGDEYGQYDLLNTTVAKENITNMNGSIQEQSNWEIFELNNGTLPDNGTDSMLTDARQNVFEEREDLEEDKAANSTLIQSTQEKNESEDIRVDGGETLPSNVNGIAWLLDLLLGTNDTSDSAVGDTDVSDFVLSSNDSSNGRQENASTTAINEAGYSPLINELDKELIFQTSIDLELLGDIQDSPMYRFIFPDGVESNAAGTASDPQKPDRVLVNEEVLVGEGGTQSECLDEVEGVKQHYASVVEQLLEERKEYLFQNQKCAEKPLKGSERNKKTEVLEIFTGS